MYGKQTLPLFVGKNEEVWFATFVGCLLVFPVGPACNEKIVVMRGLDLHWDGKRFAKKGKSIFKIRAFDWLMQNALTEFKKLAVLLTTVVLYHGSHSQNIESC